MGVRLRRSATAVLAVCSAAVAAGAQAQKMPPGSYLRKPVSSGTEISQQVKSDPLVAERYSRIFRLSADTISKAASHMKLSRLKEDRVMRVYYVHSGERLGYKVRRVPAGTPVFVANDGTPAFVKACGNPLRPDLTAGMTASLSAPAVRKFNPSEALNASAGSLDVSQVSAPATDEEGRVVGETSPMQGSVLNVADAGNLSVFTEESDAASEKATVSAPPGSEDNYLLDWYHQNSSSRLASLFSQPLPPRGGSTPGQAHSGGSTVVVSFGVPGGPVGPSFPNGGSSVGAAHAPEPGAAEVGVAMFLSGGMWLRRKRKA